MVIVRVVIVRGSGGGYCEGERGLLSQGPLDLERGKL